MSPPGNKNLLFVVSTFLSVSWKVAEVSEEATFTDVTLPPSRLLLLRRCKRGFWLHKTEINVENRSKQLTFSRTSLFNLLHCRLSEKGAMVLVQIITKYLLISLECRPHARKDANRIYTFISAGISVSNGSSINQVLNFCIFWRKYSRLPAVECNNFSSLHILQHTPLLVNWGGRD